MRHNPKLKKELVIDAKEKKQDYIEIFDEYIKKLGSARSVEGIMRAKMHFLLSLLYTLPTDSGSCYFCLLNAITGDPYVDCSFCEYAKVHGCCQDHKSDWSKLREAKQKLMAIIRNKYYKGEKYK